MTEQILLKNVQLAFPTLFEPRAVNEGDRLRYSATIVMDETDEQVLALKKSVLLASKELLEKESPNAEGLELITDPEILMESGFQVRAKAGKRPVVVKSTLKADGQNNLEKYPHYEGKITFTAATGEARPPIVVNRLNERVSEEERALFHGGVMVNIAVRPYGYARPNLGVTFALNAVQYVSAGENWASGGPTNPFAALDEGGSPFSANEAAGLDDLI